jgi:hypothetical protein
MKNLMYTNDQNQHLAYKAWEIISSENKASLQNLIILITCIENICLWKNIKSVTV